LGEVNDGKIYLTKSEFKKRVDLTHSRLLKAAILDSEGGGLVDVQWVMNVLFLVGEGRLVITPNNPPIEVGRKE
jgi:hypothetical protein